MKTKRYSVCMFPSMYGTPFFINSLTVAYIIGLWRVIVTGAIEVRIIDNKTKLHRVLL